MKITCRVCKIQQGEFFTLDSMVAIYGQKEHKLLDVYNNSFQLNASLHDSLPQVLCLSCFEKLKDFIEFKSLAEKSDLEFRVNLQEESAEESQKMLDTSIVRNLSESKSEMSIKTDDNEVTTEEEFEDIEENYDIDESIQDNEGEEIEDTDILFELYNKNDSCMEKYLNLEKIDSDDIAEECFEKEEDNDVEKLVQEINILSLPTESSQHANVNSDTILPLIEISRIESPVPQMQTIFLQPLVELRKWQCSDCGRKYLTEEKLQQHSKLHRQSENCECEICGVHLKTLYDYGVHMKTHGMERKFSCEFCDKAFSSRANLKAHLYIHSNLRPFKCEVCGKAFQQKSILKTHMTLHTGKPFECTLCHRRFSRTAHLNIHMRQHNNIRPYQCPQCPSAYMQKSHLDRHISSTHLGVRFQCNICGKMYTKKPSLNTHMREAHCTTVSLYNCDVCDLEFTKKKGLYYHLKSKHPGHKKS